MGIDILTKNNIYNTMDMSRRFVVFDVRGTIIKAPYTSVEKCQKLQELSNNWIGENYVDEEPAFFHKLLDFLKSGDYDQSMIKKLDYYCGDNTANIPDHIMDTIKKVVHFMIIWTIDESLFCEEDMFLYDKFKWEIEKVGHKYDSVAFYPYYDKLLDTSKNIYHTADNKLQIPTKKYKKAIDELEKICRDKGALNSILKRFHGTTNMFKYIVNDEHECEKRKIKIVHIHKLYHNTSNILQFPMIRYYWINNMIRECGLTEYVDRVKYAVNWDVEFGGNLTYWNTIVRNSYGEQVKVSQKLYDDINQIKKYFRL